MDCYRPVKTEAGSANFPKAKEYQKLKIGAYELEEDQKDLYTEGSDSEKLRDTASRSGETESSESEGSTQSEEST